MPPRVGATLSGRRAAMPEMFGKEYEWRRIGGKLELVKYSRIMPVVEMKPFAYDDFIGFLRKIEEEPPLPLCGTIDEWARQELMRYGIGERVGRISVAGREHGVPDQEEGRDGQVGGEVGNGGSHSALAREEGDGKEEGVAGLLGTSSRTCTACWFDSHSGCAGPRHCACWVCYEEEAQG
jgi:hypothetical protein